MAVQEPPVLGLHRLSLAQSPKNFPGMRPTDCQVHDRRGVVPAQVQVVQTLFLGCRLPGEVMQGPTGASPSWFASPIPALYLRAVFHRWIQSLSSLMLLAGCLLPASLFAQIWGTVQDSSGLALPYATVVVVGTTTGVSANGEGVYRLTLEPGQYTLEVQSLGYRPVRRTVDVDGSSQRVDMVLAEQILDLQTVEVRADAEDPALRIMREAIARRTINRQRIGAYSCSVYIKGRVRLEEVPEMFLGESVGDLGGALDSTGQGLIYLSESESRVHVQPPDQQREEMIASRVSGNQQGFSFNRFGVVDLYDPAPNLGRPLVSPLSDAAFRYYRFRLLGSQYDVEGRKWYRIAVEPRRTTDPVFRGSIDILDEQFSLRGVDLQIGGDNAKVDLFDSLGLRQTFVPLDSVRWALFQQQIRFDGQLFGFGYRGEFTAVTSDYDLAPDFPPGFFDRVELEVAEDANQRDTTYWSERRPIPLNAEERGDYWRKDSLETVRADPVWQDSMDRVENRPNWSNLIFGYRYGKRRYGLNARIGLTTDWFNAVQGGTLGLATRVQRRDPDHPGRRGLWTLRTMYGQADRRLRGQTRYRHTWNAVTRPYLEVSGGDILADINPLNTFSRLFDAESMLWNGRNINRYYQRRFLQLAGGRSIAPGVDLAVSVGWEERRQATNRSSYGWRDRTPQYRPNDDVNNPVLTTRFEDRHLWQGQLQVEWQPGVGLIKYPDRTIQLPGKWPVFEITQRMGWVPQDQAWWWAISGRITRRQLWQGVGGQIDVALGGGWFPRQPDMIQDHQFFVGAETTFVSPRNRLEGFRLLPIYRFTTREAWGQAHVLWRDNGSWLDRIPGIRKLGWQVILGADYLETQEWGRHAECFAGLDRIGWGILRPFSLVGVLGMTTGERPSWAVRVTTDLTFLSAALGEEVD